MKTVSFVAFIVTCIATAQNVSYFHSSKRLGLVMGSVTASDLFEFLLSCRGYVHKKCG